MLKLPQICTLSEQENCKKLISNSNCTNISQGILVDSRTYKKMKKNCSKKAMCIGQKEQPQSENSPQIKLTLHFKVQLRKYTLRLSFQKDYDVENGKRKEEKKRKRQLIGMRIRKWNYLAGGIEKFRNPIILNKILHNFFPRICKGWHTKSQR